MKHKVPGQAIKDAPRSFTRKDSSNQNVKTFSVKSKRKRRFKLPGLWHHEFVTRELRPCDEIARQYAKLWGEFYD